MSWSADPGPMACLPPPHKCDLPLLRHQPIQWFSIQWRANQAANQAANQPFYGPISLFSSFLVTLRFSFRGTSSLDILSYFSNWAVNSGYLLFHLCSFVFHLSTLENSVKICYKEASHSSLTFSSNSWCVVTSQLDTLMYPNYYLP